MERAVGGSGLALVASRTGVKLALLGLLGVRSAVYRGGTTLIQPQPTSYHWSVVPRTLLSR
jgi:hypothetical protein